MKTREALDKVRDELDEPHFTFRAGFDAAVSLLWPVIEASAKMSADIEEKCPTWETEGDDCSAVQVYRNLKKALSELKERVK
jgi:hypothetical protein